jgi:hypothetical protein
MRLVPPRAMTQAERVATLERRADAHDQVLKPMADQLAELYGAWTKLKTINWFIVKVAAIAGGSLGFIAVASTIWLNVSRLFTGH